MLVYWAEVGVGTWNLLDASLYVLTSTQGDVVLKKTAFEAYGGPIPANANAKIVAKFFERTVRTSAEQFLSYLKALGCLDEKDFGFSIVPKGTIGIQGTFQVGFSGYDDNGNPNPNFWDPTGNLVRGTQNDNLPGSAIGDGYIALGNHFRRSAVSDPAKPAWAITAGDYYWGSFSSSPTYAFSIGCAGITQAEISMDIAQLTMPKFLARLSKGVEIQRGLLECTLPTGAEITHIHEVAYRKWSAGLQSTIPGTGGPYGDEETTNETVSAMPGGLGLLGFDKTLGPDGAGAWVSLGSFADPASSALQAGAVRTIIATEFFQAINSLKIGPYSKFAVYPAPVAMATSIVTDGLDQSFNQGASFLDQVFGGYSSFSSAAASGDDVRYESNTRLLGLPDSVGYGAASIKFKLPDNLLVEMRVIPGGFYPALVRASDS